MHERVPEKGQSPVIVRVVLYRMESSEAADRWHPERAREFRDIPGLERIDFVRRSEPPQAGAIVIFESPGDLRAYRHSERSEWLQESIRDSWAADTEPLRESTYRVIDVSADVAAEEGSWIAHP